MEHNPQLHGVVIISLPPSDDPSKGKTITAFTLSDGDSSFTPPPPPTISTPSAIVRSPSPPRPSLFSPEKAIFALLAAVFIAASMYGCLYSELPYQLLSGSVKEEMKKNETKSFLLQLYPKQRGRTLREMGDVKLAQEKKAVTVRSDSTGSVNSSTVFPIQGNVYPDGQYYTSIFVGNPPRPYYLDVDTGSDLTWIQCDAPCTSCAKGPHSLYKPAKGRIVPPRDSLCQELQGNQNYCATCRQCDYEVEYADRSSSVGVLARDEMHLMTSDAEREKLSFVFGCAYDQRGQLLASPAKTDGILGLSAAKISLPSQLADQGVISNVIGHCITSEASGGGYLFLGDDYVPRWGITWISTLNSLSLYHTSVHNMRYGDQELSSRDQRNKLMQVIFDSGSSYTYLPNDAYTKLVSLLKSISSLVQDDSDKTLPLCWKTDFPISSISDVKKYFKPVTLHFSKRWLFVPTTFVIPPEGYLIISEKGNVCLGMLNGMEIQHGSTIILGDVSLRGKLVIYDNEQNRIGWVRSDCVRPQKTNDFPFLF
ncbi:eukaryotic aspartyl protease family protein isoform X2 [Carex rostrata]